MRVKTPWFLLVLLTIGLMPRWADAAVTRADELTLSIQDSASSPPQITVQWSQPRSSTGFQNYELMRANEVLVSALSHASIAALLVGLGTAALGFRRRRRGLMGLGLALSLCLPMGFEAWAKLSFALIHTEPNFATTTFKDTTVEADKGYYYQLLANFTSTPQQSTPVVFGRATAPVSVSDPNLVVRFDNGTGPVQTPADGTILDPNNTTAPIVGCIAETEAGCAGAPGRATITGDLFANQVKVNSSNLTGLFTQTAPLQEGPNFIHMTGSTSAGKTITLARTISVGNPTLAGALIPKALGVVFSPKPTSGPSLVDKLRKSINDQTPADWNEIFSKAKFPLNVDLHNATADLTLSVSGVTMVPSGSIAASTLQFVGASSSKAVFAAVVTIDGLDLNYSKFDATVRLNSFNFNTCPVNGPPGKVHLGRVTASATVTVEKGADPNNPGGEALFFSLNQFNSNDIFTDEAAGTSDAFSTGRNFGGPACLGGGLNLDAALLKAISDQAATVFNHIRISSTAISGVSLGVSGLTMDLKLSELSQDAAAEGLVLRFDAGIGKLGQAVTFLKTNNPPPDSRTSVGGAFPGSFPSALDAGFTLADDFLNEALAAAQGAGLLTGDINWTLKDGGTTIPLAVFGLDPSPYSASAYLPNLHEHAPDQSRVKIAISYTINPVIGLQNAARSPRAKGQMRLLMTGLIADVLVDVNRDGKFDPATEKAITLDLDVLAVTNVLLANGGAQFQFSVPVQGYTVTPGFMNVPHAAAKRLAEAIVQDRITRILGILNGIGGSGLVIPGLTFTTIDALADGGTAASYKDNLDAWGAANIDLKAFLLAILNRINAP